MLKKLKLPLIAVAALSLVVFFGAAKVSAHRQQLNHQQALELNEAGKILPAQEILAQALASQPQAQLLQMKLMQRNDAYFYLLKLANPNQEVHRLVYDASSGELVKEHSHQRMQRQHQNKPGMQHKNMPEHRKNMQEKRQQHKNQPPKNPQPAK